ncbi:30S ribosomal protein S9 [Longimonas halophila]|jgi:small subunit ribosomal protein S9|uniref:Small ribosomal subunit protein uS9 n=1 Tax=Longimonas halophila TaxID=1469170 RepID=A0A2H3NPR4_9BACT|nr:30S ribosomal protein S9 [Longimonas halophila]PEN08845.1 30S ribosomal protein S9 [Longimonas halophila]
MASIKQFNAVGRRKTSTARVYLRPGDGTSFTVNGKDASEYFPVAWRRRELDQPFVVTDTVGNFDVLVNASGGGLTGQAEAARLGIARALVEFDEELRPALRNAGYLTRDDRMVERKKYGQPKARKKSQYSKR